jgi:hypothetical protein
MDGFTDMELLAEICSFNMKYVILEASMASKEKSTLYLMKNPFHLESSSFSHSSLASVMFFKRLK